MRSGLFISCLECAQVQRTGDDDSGVCVPLNLLNDGLCSWLRCSCLQSPDWLISDAVSLSLLEAL